MKAGDRVAAMVDMVIARGLQTKKKKKKKPMWVFIPSEPFEICAAVTRGRMATSGRGSR